MRGSCLVVRILIGFCLVAFAIGCATTPSAPTSPKNSSHLIILDEEVAIDTAFVVQPQMTMVEVAHWLGLIDSIEKRLDIQVRRKRITENHLFNLKRRLNKLLDASLKTHHSFPPELELQVSELMVRIDRSIVALRDPGYVAIVEVPIYSARKIPTAGRPFQFIWPVTKFVVTSPFGHRRDPFTHDYGFHDGIDLANDEGSLIFSAERGKVIFAGSRGRAGNVVIVEHAKGYKTFYAHLNDILTVAGLTVERGQPIGLMGSTGRSTGTHLHFKVTYRDQAVDPEKFVGQILQ